MGIEEKKFNLGDPNSLMGIFEIINLKYLRDVPGWKNAPVPLCMGGDYRALTFCCKPGYQLTFAGKCRRDQVLYEIGITSDEFIKIKDDFSKIQNWDHPSPCFGSLSYCCMRRNGCYRRDLALAECYPSLTTEEIMEEYFKQKRNLAKKILSCARNKEKAAPFLE